MLSSVCTLDIFQSCQPQLAPGPQVRKEEGPVHGFCLRLKPKLPQTSLVQSSCPCRLFRPSVRFVFGPPVHQLRNQPFGIMTTPEFLTTPNQPNKSPALSSQETCPKHIGSKAPRPEPETFENPSNPETPIPHIAR